MHSHSCEQDHDDHKVFLKLGDCNTAQVGHFPSDIENVSMVSLIYVQALHAASCDDAQEQNTTNKP